MTGTPTLGRRGTEWFEARSIPAETAGRYGIYTARAETYVDDAGEERRRVVPDERGNILVFPFLDGGASVNEKFRKVDAKQFWQRPGGRKTFWNADTLDDPAVEAGAPVIITEGEPDALAAITSGFPFTVSVPDGAPAVPQGKEPGDLDPLDPGAEQTGKFEFLFNNRDRLRRVKRFILAVDSDAPGQRLAAELVRRLSAARCSFVTYPEGCKDLNDVLMRYGAETVALVLNGAKPYPVRGLYRLSDYPDLPALTTYGTGWPTLDQHLRLWLGELMVVTGIPGHGKSSWTMHLLCNLAELHGWRSVVFSAEMPTSPQLRDKLRRIRMRAAIAPNRSAAIADADAWINDSFVFIDADPGGRGEADQDFDLDWIIDRATDAVLRDGVRVLLIDPWNEIEHAKRKDESMTEYIGRSIRALKRFAKAYGVIVIIVAHPTKDVAKEGKSRPVTLYDIDGSAHFYNKPDHGVVIDWPDPGLPISHVRIAKVRFEESGEKGMVKLKFDRWSSRFEMLDHIEAAEGML